MSGPAEVTRLLKELRERNPAALDALVPLVYDELRRIAQSYMRHQGPGHILQPTALLNEAYLKLAAAPVADYRDRSHFYAAAAAVMRNILVDDARSRRSAKRGGDVTLLPLPDDVPVPAGIVDLLALDEALQTLAAADERKARLLELRVFGGLSVEEAAEALGVSVATAGRDYRFAEAWLRRALSGGAAR